MAISPFAWFRTKVPYVPQMETAECGAACLSMILGYHSHFAPLNEIREACGVSRDGASAAGIARAGQNYGLAVQAYRIKSTSFKKIQLPAIIFWEHNHFVVLEQYNSEGAVIVDPAAGRRKVDLNELNNAFSGIALSFNMTDTFQQRARDKSLFSRYMQAFLEYRSAIFFVILGSLLLEFVELIFPIATQILIDFVVKPARNDWLLGLSATVSAAAIMKIILTWIRDRVVHTLHFALDIVLMTDFVERILWLPVSFFNLRSTGDLMQRVQANQNLRDIFSKAIIALLDSLLLIGYGCLMLIYQMQLGTLVILLSIVRVCIVYQFNASQKQYTETELLMLGKEQSVIVEALSAPEMIKALGAEQDLKNQYLSRVVDRINAGFAKERVNNITSQVLVVYDGFSQALVLAFAGHAVLGETMSLGVFAAFLTLQGMLHRPLSSIVELVQQFAIVMGTVSRLNDVLETPSQSQGNIAPGELQGAICLQNVRMGFPAQEPQSADGISLNIKPNERIAIVGPSGAGKSTLIKILLGMQPPLTGKIFFDGKEISSLDQDALRAQVGVVFQEPYLFNDTVRANLCLQVENAPLHWLRHICRIACIDETIENLPNGYDTVIGEKGVRLSGGQRQRLALARTLVSRPKVLILDEATNSLDADTEADLHQSLSEINCTRIVIAHRLATVEDADRILVVDQGNIVQQGNYEQLKSCPGIFRDMVLAKVSYE